MHEDLRLAIVVNPELPLGLLANTVGAISIGLGAKLPLVAARQLIDKNGVAIDISSDRPVPILQADAETLRSIALKAVGFEERQAVVVFPAFARSLHVYAEYEAAFPEKELASEAIDGLGIAGPSKWVRSLTGSLKLLR
ncbi:MULTISPECIES: DUF2000 domain-containing protein [Brucella/Ochrobactrum group]|uniref:DUF2000 domain-containing protein n=1 Tax=Brucella/Ochrobactrum group TaxID=2826938 RepID=UPI001C041AEA|nr:DUF2000 domain-containing protein [Brucella sp. NBRC 12950]QWK79332.1 DUF2000 domain-containing protein [Ochrobactrum sp. BTU1]GLU28380.1 hypothetical protein Brsp01_36130 [Brucella sp. NBRC 12950]